MTPAITRRRLLAGLAGTMGLAGTAVTSGALDPRPTSPHADLVSRVEGARRHRDGGTVTAILNPRPVTIDLGGPQVRTWGYADDLPGPLIRARAGDLIRVDVVNDLPADTSVHWHGVALRNDMDGVPGLAQAPILSGGRHRYEFIAPDPGTYFYHPHSGLQLDRALYGVLVIDDPHDPGDYDREWIVVIDDWVDGTGRTPEDVLAALTAMSGHDSTPGRDHGSTGDMPSMGHGAMDVTGPGDMSGHGDMAGMEMMTSPLLGGAGDVAYPHYLINGRVPTAPVSFRASSGQRVRIRLVNAGSDTAFRVALGGHRMTVTHTDGFPVAPTTTDAVILGMGERLDVNVELIDGVFPLVAAAEGKSGQALALVRTCAGDPPPAAARPAELDRHVLLTHTLSAAENVALTGQRPDRVHRLVLGGSMAPYRWTINGVTFDHADPLLVEHGERVRLEFVNDTTMFHPMHLHGHTFAVTGSGARKDTVIVTPDRTVTVDFDATNPGLWMAHCHNVYHGQAGMMAHLAYRL